MAPDSGLAQAIGILFLLIVLGAFLLGFLVGRILARRLGWNGAKRSLVSLGLGAVVAGGFALVVIGNVYYRDTWAPRRQVTFNAPPGFAQNWVVLLEDRRSGSVQLVWDGVEMPFFGKKTVIDVPLSGIVRVRDLSGLRNSPRGFKVLWSDGSCNNGWGEGRSPDPSNPPAPAPIWLSTVFRRIVGHIRCCPTTKRWVHILRRRSVGHCDVGPLAHSGPGHFDLLP